MPPKRPTTASPAAPASAFKAPQTTTSSTPPKRATPPSSTTTPSTSSTLSLTSLDQIARTISSNYIRATPQRTKLLDAFMFFLVVVGALQFAYCVVAGNYPFNAFLAGFSATVGQFVLTASLRMQTNPENKQEFEGVSHERAFADFVFGSMILHFFCVNFIN